MHALRNPFDDVELLVAMNELLLADYGADVLKV